MEEGTLARVEIEVLAKLIADKLTEQKLTLHGHGNLNLQ